MLIVRCMGDFAECHPSSHIQQQWLSFGLSPVSPSMIEFGIPIHQYHAFARNMDTPDSHVNAKNINHAKTEYKLPH